ncbi:hypothetical protein EVAR_86063_1 [Eumeta japonica]|uniref:Uncharacterized protein n=1 Tax=Eumeta variegata TaxID=151549 RepID=A0A4C1UK76_EUMVA|nr:hypothetical protein EVAR_86063_1 [Eumeta japonica]
MTCILNCALTEGPVGGQEPRRSIWYGRESVYRAHVVFLREICEVNGHSPLVCNVCSLYVRADTPSINCSNFGASVAGATPLPMMLLRRGNPCILKKSEACIPYPTTGERRQRCRRHVPEAEEPIATERALSVYRVI